MGDLGQMGSSETELVEQLSAVGIKLASPPTDPHELLLLLNQTESFLSQVKQAPSESVFIALRPTIKAVVAEKLLNQSDMDLKIAIASCLAEITRITAPNAPYDNGLMKEVFQLIVDAFEKLNDISGPSYSKCVTILENIARSRLCVLLLDLEYDALVLEMFRHFLRTIRPSHTENVFSSMEAIMTHVLEESDDSELLSTFLSSLKLDHKEMSPIARHLVEKVINNCKELVQSTGISLSDYGCVVTSPCQENSSLVGQTHGEMEQPEIELVKQLLDVGSKLASPPTDPPELFSLLNQTQSFLAKVEQAPSESVFTALHPATKALVAENLLNQSDMDMKFAIASCLAQIIRITVPNAPYDDELMKEVFRLIVDAIKKLNDISSPSYSRRVEILEIVARTRLCLMILDLECESLVLEMFRHFFRTLRPCHTGNVIFWMEDIMTHVIEESDDISSELLSCLLSSAKKDDKDVLPTARELVKRVMNNCASKLKPYLNDFIQSTGTSLSDYDSVVASLCEESSNALDSSPTARKLVKRVMRNCALKLKPYLNVVIQSTGTSLNDYDPIVASMCQESYNSLGYGSLERGVTRPEEICNDEELPTLVTRNLVSTINGNSVLVPVFPEQEPEKSSQIFQSQSAVMACRADHDISSCSTDATLESLADHTTKSMRGRKSKSSIPVDIHKKSQCAGDKEALAVYTKRTGKTMEAEGLQSNCPSGKEAEMSTCLKPDKKTEIPSSSSLDRGKAFMSSASPVDSLPDRGQPSAFSAKPADQPASICVHKQTSENHQSTKELLTSNGIDTMKENKDSSDAQRKPLSSSCQKELKDTTCSGKSPIKRSPSRTETDRDSGSTPLELTNTKRSTMKESSSKQQYRKAIAEKDVSAGRSSNGFDSLERDVTCPEEIGNAEELARLVARSLVPTINSNSMLIPVCPEQELEHSPQIFQSQSASIACRADHNIPSCSINATLESLADHSTKSTRGRKNKSSILVDTHKNSQSAGDKEALAVHTQGTGKTMEIDGLQSDCPSGKQAEISTCSKPDKKTEIQSSSKLDRRNALVSSAAPIDNLPDISHPTWGQPSVFTAKQDITVVADQPSSICVHKKTSENCRTTKECLSHLSNQSKASKKGTGTMKENKDSSDSRRKPLPSSRQMELKEATCSGKSPIKRIPSRMETDRDSVSTPLELTSEKRSTRNGSSSKQQTRKAIAETDVFVGTSSKVCTTQIDEKECNQNLVGSRIEVWWPMDEKFYPGFVSAYFPDTKKHKIIYDDDDTETLTLKDERWKLVNQVKGKNIRKPYVSSKRNAVVIDLESDGGSGSSKDRREATTTQPNTSLLGEESTPDTHHRRRGVSGSSKDRKEVTTTQPKTSVLREEITPDTHHQMRGVFGSSKDRREATTTQPKTSVLREESTPNTHHQMRGVSGSSKVKREATTTQPKTYVLREESTPDAHHQRRGVSGSSKDRREATTTQPKTFELREEITPDTHHQRRGVSGSSKDRSEATTIQPKTSVLREESTPDTHHRRRGVFGSSKDRKATTTQTKTSVLREESTPDTHHQRRGVSGSSKDRKATTTQTKTSVLREESTPDTHHQMRGVSGSSKDRREATTTQLKTSVLREESTPDTHHRRRGVSGSSKDRREATTTQPETSVLREESTPDTHHQRRGVSGSSKDRRELKTYVSREESTANSLHRKRPVVECETKSSSPTTAEGRSKRVKRSVASERTSLISVDKTSSAIKTRTTGRKSLSNYPAVQDISPVPASTEQVKKASTEVSSLKRTLLQDEEIEDLSVVEAERRLQRGKRRKLDPVITDDVATPLTPQASTSDDPHVERIFTPDFTEKIRVFSLICRNKWYERNLEPLPDYAEFADEFGRDAAFDHGNLFKTIRQIPHYRGLDTSDTGLLLDLWYKLPLLIEALHRSVSSQHFLEKNKETIKGWLTKLTEAGFDISVPLAAFELLTIWPANFVNFRESLDSVSRQLNEERQNLEALKSKLPVSERVAGLDSKIEDLKRQIRDLESERTSLVPLKSVELELEKYGTSMKAYRLQKLKELHEKELEEAKQFLEEVSLGGWYERIRLAPLAE